MLFPLIFLLLFWCFGDGVGVAGFSSISSLPSSSCSRNNFYPSPSPSALATHAAVVDTTTTTSTTQQPAAVSAFHLLIQKAVQTIIKSDTDGDELEHSYGSASQGLWLHSKSARGMQSLLDRIVLQVSSPYYYNSRRSSIPSLLEEKTADSGDATKSEAKRKTRDKTHNNNNNDEEEEDAFESIVKESFQTIIQSDVHRPDGSSSQGRWVYDPAARRLQALMDRLVIHVSVPTVRLLLMMRDVICHVCLCSRYSHRYLILPIIVFAAT
jgi:hypothetical protein